MAQSRASAGRGEGGVTSWVVHVCRGCVAGPMVYMYLRMCALWEDWLQGVWGVSQWGLWVQAVGNIELVAGSPAGEVGSVAIRSARSWR